MYKHVYNSFYNSTNYDFCFFWLFTYRQKKNCSLYKIHSSKKAKTNTKYLSSLDSSYHWEQFSSIKVLFCTIGVKDGLEESRGGIYTSTGLTQHFNLSSIHPMFALRPTDSEEKICYWGAWYRCGGHDYGDSNRCDIMVDDVPGLDDMWNTVPLTYLRIKEKNMNEWHGISCNFWHYIFLIRKKLEKQVDNGHGDRDN